MSRLALGGGNLAAAAGRNSLVALPAAAALAPNPVLGVGFKVMDAVAGEVGGDGLFELGQLLDRAEERPRCVVTVTRSRQAHMRVARATGTHGATRSLRSKSVSGKTDIPTLKVKQNKVFGYYIEVSTRYLIAGALSAQTDDLDGERYIDDEIKPRRRHREGALPRTTVRSARRCAA